MKLKKFYKIIEEESGWSSDDVGHMWFYLGARRVTLPSTEYPIGCTVKTWYYLHDDKKYLVTLFCDKIEIAYDEQGETIKKLTPQKVFNYDIKEVKTRDVLKEIREITRNPQCDNVKQEENAPSIEEYVDELMEKHHWSDAFVPFNDGYAILRESTIEKFHIVKYRWYHAYIDKTSEKEKVLFIDEVSIYRNTLGVEIERKSKRLLCLNLYKAEEEIDLKFIIGGLSR